MGLVPKNIEANPLDGMENYQCQPKKEIIKNR